MAILKDPIIMNIGLIGGGTYCKEFLEKIILDYKEKDVNARIQAVADPNPQSPGIVYAKQLGVKTYDDYHELYQPQHQIHLLIILTPSQSVLEDVLAGKPSHIRILSYNVFIMTWKAIGVEERKLRERNKEIETILHGIQEFISVITPDLEIVEVNDALLNQMHFSREEVIGKKCHEIFQNSKEPCPYWDLACPLNEVIRNQRAARRVMKRTLPDGDQRHFEVTIYPIWEKDGKISKFIDISRDITDRVKEEEEITRRLEKMVEDRTRQLKETHEKLLHQDKMASLGKLAATVVHEINNPIAGVLNLVLLIKRMLHEEPLNEKDLEQFKQYLHLMETEIKRTSRIVANLLAFSRQSKMEFRPLRINQILETVLILDANLFKINGIKIEKTLGQDLPDVYGSGDHLQQVFMNVISNAVEAMEINQTGILTITTQYQLNAKTILIQFADTGKGMAQEDICRVFEPFYTKKTKGKGVGLGLSVAYGIIQDHGGMINIQSDAGTGTIFKIEIPVGKREAPLEMREI